jgi:hypothetical protein
LICLSKKIIKINIKTVKFKKQLLDGWITNGYNSKKSIINNLLVQITLEPYLNASQLKLL